MNTQPSGHAHLLDAETAAFYRNVMQVLELAGVPCLVGGAYAFAYYTKIVRHTKDFDLFLRPDDLDRALGVLRDAGYRGEKTFPHWLGKVFYRNACIDLIFRSGNGLSEVDGTWFDHARTTEVLDVRTRLCAPEDIIWMKAFIQERERYDGADVAHLLLGCAADLDWDRLVHRFGPHWRVLLSHLVLFGFVYPSERQRIPPAVHASLLERLRDEAAGPPSEERVCRGTLLSRAQYLVDVNDWEYLDARQQPIGILTPQEIRHWTDAIDKDI